MDPSTFNNVIIASAAGGVDIEIVAKDNPEALHRIEIPGNESKPPPSLVTGLARKVMEELPASARAIVSTEGLTDIISNV